MTIGLYYKKQLLGVLKNHHRALKSTGVSLSELQAAEKNRMIIKKKKKNPEKKKWDFRFFFFFCLSAEPVFLNRLAFYFPGPQNADFGP